MSAGRSYGGESPEDRASRRRRQLLDAGLEVFGTQGYRQATVRQLCREAKVADRYFYEQFDHAEDLLLAVYEECTGRLEQAVLAAVADLDAGAAVEALAESGLDAFLGVVEADPRLARLVWFEVLGVSSRVEAAYLERMHAFGRLLLGLLGERSLEIVEEPESAVVVDALVGGISHAVMVWVTRGFTPPRAVVRRALERLLTGASAGLLAPVDPA